MSDPYQDLELERGADARAIKAAYFRLMRLHPPEKDPEAFQRIRAAYDLLSDPESRAAYDAERQRAEEHGEEAQAVLRASRECLSEGEPAKARDMLERLLAQNPAIQEARELLGFALLRLEQTERALEEFQRLAQADPKSAAYRIHISQTLRISNRISEATQAAREALALEPGNVDTVILLGELLREGLRWKEAKALWEESIASASSALDALRLRLCFVDVYIKLHEQEATEAVLEQIAQDLERSRDNDLRRFVADRLSALSANLFASELGLAGNVLLSAAGRFSPSPVFETALPPRVDVLLEDLPESSRAFLAQQVKGVKPRRLVAKSPWVLIALGLALLAVCGFLLSKATSPGYWGFWEVAGMAVAAVPAGQGLARGAWALRRRTKRTSLAPYTFLHPLYLLRTQGEALEAWPLLRLESARLFDQHNQGRYVQTLVHLRFGPLSLEIPIAGNQAAGEWAQGVLDARNRALQLLSRGLLGAEPAADLIPRELLTEGRAPTKAERRRTRESRMATAAGLAAAAALCAVSPFAAARIADRSWGREALYAGTPRGLRDYLRRFPNGTWAREVNEALDAMFEKAALRVERRAGAPRPVARKLLTHLRANPKLAIEVVSDTRWPEGDAATARLAGLVKDSKDRDARLAGRMRQALSNFLAPGIAEDDKAAAARLELRYAVSPSDDWLEVPGKERSRGVEVLCKAAVAVGSETLASVAEFRRAEERYATTAETLREDPLVIQREMVLSGMDACASALLTELLGTPEGFGTHEPILVKQRALSGSPYRGAR